jgi:regulator of protease activity HflC (stomatin/prohibitin superfamily)
MEQNVQKTGIVNWVALLGMAVVSAALARQAQSAAGLVGTAFLGIGFLAAAVSYFQMRLEDRERLERLEVEELKKTRSDSALFADTTGETLLARRSREQFERFLVPAFTVVLFLLQGGAAYGGWRWLEKAGAPALDRATLTLALYGLCGLILFLLGCYSARLARLDRQRLLRPGASYLMLGAVMCFLVAATEATAYFGFPRIDRVVARVFCGVLALTAVETLIGLVFEIYRPRVRGQAARLLYESRLIGLLGEPGGLITTAAQALDYQFGFKVSETWFYKFLERALSWIILLQLTALWASTTFVIIEPGEQALLERFGKPVTGRAVLEPGLHFKWPWPVDRVYRYQTRQIQSFIVGVIPDPELDKEKTVLWTKPHYKEEFNMLVASRDPGARTDIPGAEKPVPANLLVASIPVQYQITNLVAWAYNHANADKVLEHVANREVVRYLVNVDFDSVMSSDRQTAGEALHRRIQDRANELNLGVQVIFVGLQNIHPPIGNRMLPLAQEFEKVVGAMQQKQTNILAAQAYEARRIPAASAEATNLVTQARSDQLLRVSTATAEAARFTNQLAAFRASPTVYPHRTRLEALATALPGVKKYVVVATNTQDVVVLDLEETVRPDLLTKTILPPDATPPAEKKN